MKVFDFDPAFPAHAFARHDWVYVPEGVSEEFHASLVEYAEREMRAHVDERFAFKGKKEQAVYEPPADVDLGELFDVVAAVCGLDRRTMTLSERHIQIYEPNAAPDPPAHKDRFPSQVSVGLSIAVPEVSRLVLYPYSHRELNVFNTSVGLRRSLQPDELPEVALKGAREVTIADRPRDVVMFAGNSTWHLRRHAANSVNLYFKFNDFGCDPLGEDPATARIRDRSLAALDGEPAAADALVPVLARRMDTVSRTHTRADWQPVLQARVFGEEPFGITERQFDLLRAADGRHTLGELASELGGAFDRQDAEHLVRMGALDLVPAAEAPRAGRRGSAALRLVGG